MLKDLLPGGVGWADGADSIWRHNDEHSSALIRCGLRIGPGHHHKAPGGARQRASHFEIWKYYQSASKVHAYVPQNLRVPPDHPREEPPLACWSSINDLLPFVMPLVPIFGATPILPAVIS